jgi:hypothetical protein
MGRQKDWVEAQGRVAARSESAAASREAMAPAAAVPAETARRWSKMQQAAKA